MRRHAVCAHQTLSEAERAAGTCAGDLIATGTPAGCAAKAPGKLVYFVMNHCLSPATKWSCSSRRVCEPAVSQAGRPHDGVDPAPTTAALDLGEQRNRNVAA